MALQIQRTSFYGLPASNLDVGSYAALCRAVAELSKNAEVVLVLSGGKLAASQMKFGGPTPDEDEFRRMLSQLENVIATIKINQDKFGELESVAIHYKYVDGLFFPINNSDTLIVGIMPPYDPAFSASVMSLIKKQALKRSDIVDQS